MTTTPEVSPTRTAAVAEDLYALLPAHIRQVDLAAGGSLRALFGVLAGSSVELDAELDTYYDALFVETADHVALPHLAALVGAIPLQALPSGATFDERAYVANTIRYRRGKGTARVLESLAADVTGSPAVAVEYFLRIARLQHLLDVRPERPATGQLVGGDVGARSGSAFDRLPRLVDVRAVAPGRGRPTGRHGIPSVAVHLLRPVVPVFPAPPATGTLAPALLAGVPQARRWTVGGVTKTGFFQLAAQPERVLRLFAADRVADVAGDRPLTRDLPDRMRRLPLHQETAELREADVEGRQPRLTGRRWFDQQGGPFRVFVRRSGQTTFSDVPPARLRIANLESPPSGRPLATLTHVWSSATGTTVTRHIDAADITCAIDPVTGRIVAAQPPSGTPDIVEVRVAYATGRGRPIGAGAQERGSAEQPFDIRDDGPVHDLVWVVDPASPTGGSAETGSRTVGTVVEALTEVATLGTGRRSFVVLARCDVEGVPSGSTSLDVTVPSHGEVHLVAAEWRAPLVTAGTPGDPDLRGFVVRRERRFTVDAPVRVQAPSGAAMGDAGRLVVDGLELTQGLVLATRSVRSVELRHSTIRSPGAVAVSSTTNGILTDLDVRVTDAICGPIQLGGPAGGVTGDLTICNSVVAADGAITDAIRAPGLDCCLTDVTVLGTSAVRALEATNVLFDEPVTVTRRQSGCVRYSWVPEGSATPRGFRCQPQLALTAAREAKGAPLGVSEAAQVRLSVRPVLMDRSLDEPTVAMLHAMCPDAIVRGGEDEAEMGAFSVTGWGIARANLVSLFDDFVPSALRAGVIDDTRSAAVAQRRNRP